MHQDLLDAIIKKKLHSPLPNSIPKERQHPIVPFLQEPRIICEIKRSSPSKGSIAPGLHATAQAEHYTAAGITSISVLTEEHYFKGSIADLMAVKSAFPHCALLQKDFILSKRDIEIAYCIGADAVLLLASVLKPDTMAELLEECRRFGLQALVEVHSKAEIAAVAPMKPVFTGVNARDLRSFNVDPLVPLALREQITWPSCCVFESGIQSPHGLSLALQGGFDAILVGEAVVRNPELAPALIARYKTYRSTNNPRTRNEPVRKQKDQKLPPAAPDTLQKLQNTLGNPHPRSFWNTIAQLVSSKRASGLPLVKICGICTHEDALFAVESGADMLGFITVPSQRKVSPAFIASLSELSVLKVAVVELSAGAPHLDPAIAELLEQGILDAVQLHGDETPDICEAIFPAYKALRPRDQQALTQIADFPAPRTLLDAYSPHAKGGTGMRIADDILQALPAGHPLWLAGGINPRNVAAIIQRYRPECIDVSSGLEEYPTKKSHKKIKEFFTTIASLALTQ